MAPNLAKLFAGAPLVPGAPPRGRQTRDLDGIYSVFAWTNHPEYGITPDLARAIFEQAEQGDPSQQCDLFDGLEEGDAHLRSLFEKRRQAVAGKPFVIKGGGAGAAAEQGARVLREAFRRLPVIDTFKWLLDFQFYGYACVEIDWGVLTFEGREWIVPTWFTLVDARRFRIANESTPQPRVLGELRLYTDIRNPHGEPLVPFKWLVLRADTDVARAGLMRTATRYAVAKRWGFRDMILFSEKYGLPFPAIKYKTGPEHADDEALDTATKILENIGQDSGAVHPDTIEINFAEVGQSGDSSKVHSVLVSHCNREMSKLVNGSTLSNDNSDSGGASYALGEVHDSVRWEAVQHDATCLATAFQQQLFEPFCSFNGLAVSEPYELSIQVVRDLTPAQRVDLAIKMKNELGVPISVSQLRSETGYREPTDERDSAPGVAVAPATAPGVAA